MLKLWQSGQQRQWLQNFKIRWPFTPRYHEIDTFGHVSNVVYDSFFEAGRLEYFKAIGDPEPLEAPFPFAHVVAEQHIRFMTRCFFDEPLVVLTRISEFGRSSATIEQAIADANDELRAVACTTIVRNDGNESRPWTAAQREAIATFEGFLTSDTHEF
ncbi:MAG: hypothetical protein DLM50_04130 [Candidatus Meridianibacter frigidus]|nr:MAG: hypothetical protein DLM50_04130 [Candidatus Eremiobacteraeota bacterium]